MLLRFQQLRDTCTWDGQSRVISLTIWTDRTTIESSSSLRNVHKLSPVSGIENNSPILRISHADPTKSKHFQVRNALHLAILKNHPSIPLVDSPDFGRRAQTLSGPVRPAVKLLRAIAKEQKDSLQAKVRKFKETRGVRQPTYLHGSALRHPPRAEASHYITR